ncbi:MAG TPA: sulfatase-like hydrolase/transferase, partial [Candidatus Latescibacteria bacterium]|nr:sulfatase-like hydrolase/transferase [Candidatus Latescibacterota bacterium]
MKRALPAAGLALVSLLGLLSPTARAGGAELNLLLVTIDTLRPDRLSCYSPKYLETPRIDALAAKGVLFERAFAHDPITLASHANIFLGMTSLAHGISENSLSIVAPDYLTLAELLKSRGYATGAFVSAFPLDSRFGLDQGFDVYDDSYPSKPTAEGLFSERPAEKTIAAALKWLSARKGHWFCWIHLWDPHAPYAAPEPYASRFKDKPYIGEVAYVDAELGRLLDEIGRQQGTIGQTVVVLTADHGESLGDHGEMTHGYFAYNSTLWVPLIISVPGASAARVKDCVSHVDIFPTVCDLLAVDKPASLHGDSLAPFLKGKTRKARPIYFESLDAYLNRGWAPIRGFIENGKKYLESPIPELYDLESDFGEEKNLATAENLPPFKRRLREVMELGASPLLAQAGRQTTDRETKERLRSLGYTASRAAQTKASYGPEDDLKTLLPFEQKADAALQLQKQGRLAESVRLLEDIIKERKDFGKAYNQLFEIYRSQGLLDDGFQVLERAFTANPGNYLIVSGYGIALVKNGRDRKGAEILEKAIGLYDRDATAWNSLGVAYGKTGDFEKARAAFVKALTLAPDDALFNDNFGSYYVTVAVKTKDAEAARQSVGYFEKAIAADPSLAAAYNGLGGALNLLGRNDEAIINWEKALELDPSFAFAAYNLALAYLEKGDKAKALENCQKYLLIRGRSITPEERNEIDALIKK